MIDLTCGGETVTTGAVSCSALASRTSILAWMGLKPKVAFEHNEVTFVHVIQRCERIETQLVGLLGECVSIRRDARDGEILEPCFDVRQF